MRFLIHLTFLSLAFGLMESKYLFYKNANFTLSEKDGDYFQAQTWCKELHGFLPSITDAGDFEFLIRSLIWETPNSNDLMFLGATCKDDAWKWHDGQPWKEGISVAEKKCACSSPCCGLVTTTKANATLSGKIFSSDGCGMKGRMVCQHRM